MAYFLAALASLAFILIAAPFWLFSDKMDAYGSYLTGLAAIGAALKFVSPYLLIFFYQKRYSNEVLWTAFLKVSCPENEDRTLESEWIAGVIGYFRRCEETLHMGNPWYNRLPSISDDIYWEFGGKKLVGKKESALFEEIKDLLFKSAHIVSMNSTPDSPIRKEEKYKELHAFFKELVKKSDEMNELLVDVPVPVKKIIEGNDFYKSFFKK